MIVCLNRLQFVDVVSRNRVEPLAISIHPVVHRMCKPCPSTVRSFMCERAYFSSVIAARGPFSRRMEAGSSASSRCNRGSGCCRLQHLILAAIAAAMVGKIMIESGTRYKLSGHARSTIGTCLEFVPSDIDRNKSDRQFAKVFSFGFDAKFSSRRNRKRGRGMS